MSSKMAIEYCALTNDIEEKPFQENNILLMFQDFENFKKNTVCLMIMSNSRQFLQKELHETINTKY